jgi:hypothetical protein
MRLLVRVALLAGAALAGAALRPAVSAPTPSAAPVASAARADLSQPIFTDRAAEAGLVFTHVNGMTGKLYMPEMMGAGVALIDYDNDGRMDVFLVTVRVSSTTTPGPDRTASATSTSPTSPPRAASSPPATAWASRWATTTTTATPTST